MLRYRNFKRTDFLLDKLLKDYNISDKVTGNLDNLENVGCEYFTASKVNTQSKNIVDGLKAIRDFDADGIMARAGGPIIDTAKLFL